MPYTTRPYQTPADYACMRHLLAETYRLAGLPVYCTLGDLDWWRSIHPDPCAISASQMWFDAGGSLAGFTWQESDLVDLMTHPDHRGLEQDILDWAEERQKYSRRKEGAEIILRAWCFEGDGYRQALLESKGYTQAGWRMFCRSRSLTEPVPETTLPPGYTIHPVRGETDLEARVAVQRNAFAPSQMTPAKYRAVTNSPTYRQDLDLAVEAPDGSLAAFCTIWYDEVNHLGEYEPVGCHSAHRRLGLTKAVMAEGLHRLKSLGAETAMVFCEADEEAPNRLYESLEFAPVDVATTWKKVLA